MSHSHGGLGVTIPLRTNIIPPTQVWNAPHPLQYTPGKKGPDGMEKNFQYGMKFSIENIFPLMTILVIQYLFHGFIRWLI